MGVVLQTPRGTARAIAKQALSFERQPLHFVPTVAPYDEQAQASALRSYGFFDAAHDALKEEERRLLQARPVQPDQERPARARPGWEESDELREVMRRSIEEQEEEQLQEATRRSLQDARQQARSSSSCGGGSSGVASSRGGGGLSGAKVEIDLTRDSDKTIDLTGDRDEDNDATREDDDGAEENDDGAYLAEDAARNGAYLATQASAYSDDDDDDNDDEAEAEHAESASADAAAGPFALGSQGFGGQGYGQEAYYALYGSPSSQPAASQASGPAVEEPRPSASPERHDATQRKRPPSNLQDTRAATLRRFS